MDEFIAYIVKNLVETPEEVRVDMREIDGRLHIEVRAASEDLSRVIGRGGRTIQAIRTIAATAAARHSCRVRIDVIDDEQEKEAEAAPAAAAEAEPTPLAEAEATPLAQAEATPLAEAEAEASPEA